ncbi:pseudouridylate synthase TRUB2, mitochondrial [Tribolium castaneum]|uniref:Putative tRNA pseudouridine synthase 2-like Protein n=1 Tax=Tribolium castaneum TaxID=7070 RepID=D6WJW6_TRICA|nr:PREDICTED: probable tRNA pseudouridine synthase 2 [Tribolium castaneum]EFA03912.2 putative tRNA pseudouridine synthase 2-like Protein [Tribolium castaneum]|eukprot:XP_973881.1 PREDICTED: probable tRNA pseudouridine synthase 2 [Tribolium castaneum]
MLIKDAPVIWEGLRSIICVYKPPSVTCERVRKTIIAAVCKGLNEMECRPPVDFVCIEGNPSGKLTVSVKPSLADDPLVVGPRYIHDDLKCSWSNFLGFNTSGVLLLGLGKGTKVAKLIRENRPTRCYRLSGKLGEATDNAFKDGKVVERTTWRHVKLENMNRFLATLQASHQKEMFKSCGIDLQSEEAYKLACQGPIRPANSKLPVIYGIKCVKFEPPEFVIEIQCINEYETYLRSLIHEIGMKLHSSAHCTAIQCIRHSYFTVENALLRKHWTLQDIITNMEQCIQIMDEHENIIRQKSAALQ